MILPEIKKKIQDRLVEIESEFNVEILLAIESGSRAWGFESIDSDYDIRFIYKHKTEWYLSVLPGREVIEIPIVDLMDCSGWDLRKSFFLMNKSNPVLFEWLRSPIVYKKNDTFYEIFFDISKEYFSPIGTVYHYLHMATGNFKEYLKQEHVRVKKYFYVLRPLLACAWVEQKKSSPPMEFQVLLDSVLSDSIVRREIDLLLSKKRSGIELGEGNRIDILNEFIETQIRHFEMVVSGFDPAHKPDPKKMDLGFQKILNL
ncbi:nucleotidyltransferase domain-containing protein [Leptospira interrogans]|uniref:Putative nucleotidyltransferase n=1 Tax=Leptospira interrogans str. 2006001854 TaxID=1001590 RepID=M6G9V6_LEPIR|nr:nucleotidyltransferase domain-containing protein [Leptospira interrogans]EMM81500.1 putative nucleotidyltransferase [Leptospira interrogans str. 2006001854]MCR8639589.1 nucleotidyltransferase [Leptospira interrogans serovar Ricardi]UMQ57183.1 nucleotidyltransferase domain-containing protein [Leptospira interrogans]UNE65930.1 nucleotidyltransferase domain-containing protein [Leptospira interrogans]